ncbi:MAG TPA: alpha/beta fold hydrolase [Ktedonobacterales bacterium]|nr:alpha/beta fold hydrolase [Ktedonobacterales bacterium]
MEEACAGAPRTIPTRTIPKWLPPVASGIGLAAMAVTSGAVLLANHFVDELSRPHQLMDESRLPPEVAELWQLPHAAPEPPLACQRALDFESATGLHLRGDFWAQPRPAPTVVICHGYRASRADLRPVAALEYSHGFNVLLFDFRGHGDSASVATTGGNAEVRDLEAALSVAAAQPETLPGEVVIHGFSMGAAIALLTPPHPDVAAIIADSPYAWLDDILRRLVQWQLGAETARWARPLRPLRHVIPAVAWTTVAASALVFRVRFGHALLARPANTFGRRAAKRTRAKVAALPRRVPILLIHATGDAFIPIEHARRIAASATSQGVPLETYFAESGVHCGAYGHDPERYIAVMLDFVTRSLSGHAASA